jgi:AcrR family transcriptional regulator
MEGDALSLPHAVPDVPSPSPRSDKTRRKLIATAIELLDEHGEQGFRIADVQRRSGISVGSLYHHFGGRDGLIQAARAEQFRSSIPTYGVMVLELLEASTSADEFLAGLLDVLRFVHAPDRAEERFRRLAYIGSAMSRPDLLEELRAQQTELLALGGQLAEALVERRWVKEGVSAHALVTFTQALELGSVVADLDLGRDDEIWVHVVHSAIASLFVRSAGASGVE